MAPKKAAKKALGKHDQPKAGRDARRTFEHLGRVQAIASLITEDRASIQVLISMADAAFRSNHHKQSADLLRAAEHLSFASIVETDSAGISGSLLGAIQEEFDHLVERAEEHGAAKEAPAAIRTIYRRMAKDAASAMRRDAYRTALELARGAEALTHLRELHEPQFQELDERLVGAGKPMKNLKG